MPVIKAHQPKKAVPMAMALVQLRPINMSKIPSKTDDNDITRFLI